MKTNVISIVSLALVVTACGGGTKKSFNNLVTNPSLISMEDAPVVGEKIAIGTDSMVVMKLREEPKKVTLRASDLLDDLRLIKLEDKEDALVGAGKVWTDGKHIAIYDGNVVKLFDINGKYLGNVGAKGNGPGEYVIAPYDIDFGTDGDGVYMLQYGAKKIMCYDMGGNYVEDIPLPHEVHKGFVDVNSADKTATVGALVFNVDENQDVMWQQDFDGNVLSHAQRPGVALVPDFSNEVYKGYAARGECTYSVLDMCQPKADTLYRYSQGDLVPEMTVDFGGEVPMHEYLSFPEFYVVTTYGEPQNVTEHSYIVPANSHFVIDKKSLHGAPADILLDNIGTVTVGAGWAYQSSPGFFVLNYDPGTLLEMIESAPTEHPLATAEGIKVMNDLKNSIDPDENNYLIFGRWKE